MATTLLLCLQAIYWMLKLMAALVGLITALIGLLTAIRQYRKKK